MQVAAAASNGKYDAATVVGGVAVIYYKFAISYYEDVENSL